MDKSRRIEAVLLVCACCILSSILVSWFLAGVYGRAQYRFTAAFAEEAGKRLGLREPELAGICKESIRQAQEAKGQEYRGTGILDSYGYGPESFQRKIRGKAWGLALLGTLVFLFCLWRLARIRSSRRHTRISGLTQYLEKIDQKGAAVLPKGAEDEFACLEDEIQKTVEKLTLTREAAWRDKERLSENLADISHQIKTYVTAISLRLSLKENMEEGEVLKKQLAGLNQLVEHLLTLSRIDAGVLVLEKKPVDVYTLLSLSSELAQEILLERGQKVELPNHPQTVFTGDLDWSVEAFLNLIKNCAEHTPRGGKISFAYSQNPLYTQITIEDEGEGFTKEELSHVFERFYQGEGRRRGKAGTGLGLALAKSVVELQNGSITAENRPEGGARFTIQFYACH